MDSIIIFIIISIFSIPIGFSIFSFIAGKFPAKSTCFGLTHNYVVWGDRNVDPKLLTSKRARFLSVLFFLIFGLFILALSNLNNLFGNVIVTNIVSIALGIIVGIFLYRKMIAI